MVEREVRCGILRYGRHTDSDSSQLVVQAVLEVRASADKRGSEERSESQGPDKRFMCGKECNLRLSMNKEPTLRIDARYVEATAGI